MSTMKHLFLFMAVMLAFRGFAQKGRDGDIRKTLQQLFDAMKAGDSATARLLFEPGAYLQTALFDSSSGVAWVETIPLDSFLKQVASVSKGNMKIEERMISCAVKTDLPMASAWVEYEFYIRDALSHKGVNAIQLYKSLSGWKILYICDTRRRSR